MVVFLYSRDSQKEAPNPTTFFLFSTSRSGNTKGTGTQVAGEILQYPTRNWSHLFRTHSGTRERNRFSSRNLQPYQHIAIFLGKCPCVRSVRICSHRIDCQCLFQEQLIPQIRFREKHHTVYPPFRPDEALYGFIRRLYIINYSAPAPDSKIQNGRGVLLPESEGSCTSPLRKDSVQRTGSPALG